MRNKKIASFVAHIILCVCSLIILLFVWFYIFGNVGASGRMPCHGRTLPDYFHNIFTGKCEFESYGPCFINPWYIKPGCDLDKQELISVAQNSRGYGQADSFCKMLCLRQSDSSIKEFCSYTFNSDGEKITCEDFFDCDAINCSNID